MPREKIVQQLAEVEFDEEMQKQLVGSLSGGWKMRLELARAMLYDADLLLLDEPTNHVRLLNGLVVYGRRRCSFPPIDGCKIRKMARRLSYFKEKCNLFNRQSRFWISR